MIQSLKVWCNYIFQLVKIIVEGCFCKFLAKTAEPKGVLSKYHCYGLDNRAIHQRWTHSCTTAGTGEPLDYEIYTADIIRRRHEVFGRMLEYVETESKLLADEFTALIKTSSPDWQDSEFPLTHIESVHAAPSEESSGSSINNETHSMKIRTYLQSVIAAIEKAQNVSSSTVKSTAEWQIEESVTESSPEIGASSDAEVEISRKSIIEIENAGNDDDYVSPNQKNESPNQKNESLLAKSIEHYQAKSLAPEDNSEQVLASKLSKSIASTDNSCIKPESSSSITFKGISSHSFYMPQLVASNFGMNETAHDWDVNWTHDFVSFRTCRKMKYYQRINHFPGSICLSNKDLLGRGMNVMYECFPRDYDIFPKTWFVPGDMAKIERYARRNKESSFIVKPHDGGAGSGIKITSSLREINSHGKNVCQLYIQRPFLIDGYKFDFRVYVLISSVKPLRIFVHKEGLARFATVKYEKPSAYNLNKKWMHLTNTCVNKNSPSYIRDGSSGSTRRITNVFQWFVDNKIDVVKIQDSMDDAIIKTIIAGLPLLQHYYRLSFPCHTTSISCFELMGFDIMLDHKLKVYVLEVNVAPSFANETGTSHVACVKQEVVSDTFRILNLMESEKNYHSNARIKKRNYKMRLQRINKDEIGDSITKKRIEWENSHLGNFRKVYPSAAIRERYYQKFIDKALSRLRPNHYLNGKETELTSEQRKWLT